MNFKQMEIALWCLWKFMTSWVSSFLKVDVLAINSFKHLTIQTHRFIIKMFKINNKLIISSLTLFDQSSYWYHYQIIYNFNIL